MGRYSYILSGLGQLDGIIYDNTDKLFSILESNNVTAKLKKIPQLGAISYSMPGARHTRYEYVILQFDLINKLSMFRGSEYNSTSNKKFNLVMQNAPFAIEGTMQLTLGDMLQTLSLISNIGYTKNTFLDSKILLKQLRTNKEFKKKYKYALGKEFANVLEILITSNDYWSLQYLNGVILLRKCINEENRNVIHLALNILYKFLDKSDENKLNDDIEISKSIRTLAFVIIDLNFSPLPLNFNSNNLPAILEKIISKHSTSSNTNQFLLDMANLLEKNIYLEPNNLLAKACLEELIEKELEKFDFNRKNMINQLLSEESPFFKDYKVCESWNKNILKIDIPSDVDLENVIELESKLRRTSGIIFYSAEFRNESFIRLCLSLRTDYPGDKNIALKKVFCYIANFIINYTDYCGNQNELKILLVKYYLSNVFLQSSLYLESKYNKYDYDFISLLSGVSNTLTYGNLYLENGNLDKDQKYEISCTLDYISRHKFSGLTCTLLCSVKIKNKEYKDVAEIDGMIIYPTQSKLILIEAKNKKNSRREAIEALETKKETLQLSSVGNLSIVEAQRYERGYYSFIELTWR